MAPGAQPDTEIRGEFPCASEFGGRVKVKDEGLHVLNCEENFDWTDIPQVKAF
jgi:hypothetical protein